METKKSTIFFNLLIMVVISVGVVFAFNQCSSDTKNLTAKNIKYEVLTEAKSVELMGCLQFMSSKNESSQKGIACIEMIKEGAKRHKISRRILVIKECHTKLMLEHFKKRSSCIDYLLDRE